MTGKTREQDFITSIRYPRTWQEIIKKQAEQWRCNPSYVIRTCLFAHLIQKHIGAGR